MANYTWTGSSGSWGTATNWSGGVVPTLNDNVLIQVPGSTVSVDSGVLAQAYSLVDQYGAFTIGTSSQLGGTLQTVSYATFDGTFSEYAGGLFYAGGTGALFAGAMNMAGGTINLRAGAQAEVAAGGSLAGTFSGNGTLSLYGGNTYINTGFSSSLSRVTVGGGGGGKLGFNINYSMASTFIVASDGVVDLFDHTLTLTGNAALNGTISGGYLKNSGGTITLGTPNGPLTYLDNGLVLTVSGTTAQGGNVSFGAVDSGAEVSISKTGQYLINGNFDILDPSTTGTIINGGIFAKTGGGKAATIFTSLTSTGAIKTEIGTLLLDGLVNSVAGSVSGAGTLGIAGGQTTLGNTVALTMAALDQQSGLLVLNKALSYSGEWDMTGGVLNLNHVASKLSLSGQVNLDGGLITGYGGTLLIDNAQIGNVTIGGPNTLTITGTLDQTNTINLGLSSNPVVNVDAGAVWSIEGDSDIIGGYGLIKNAGTFRDGNGSGTAAVFSELVSTGTITVNNSTLELAGTNALSGIISGSGTLDLANYTGLNPGVAITVAALDVDDANVTFGGNTSYANSFYETGNQAMLSVTTLSLTGTTSLDGGTLASGTLSSAGLTTVGYYTIADAELLITGTAEQVNGLTINGGLLDIGATGTYTIDDDYSIAGGAVLNAGNFVSAGTSFSAISAAFDQTGTLTIDGTALALSGGGALGGAITGPGTLQLTAGTFTLNAGLNISLSSVGVLQNADLALAANETYAGYWDETSNNSAIALNGNTLSLTGTTQLVGATLTGAGDVRVSGSTTLNAVYVVAGALLEVAGATEQLGAVSLTSFSTLLPNGNLTIEAGGVYTMDAGAVISGLGTLTVSAGGSLTAPEDGTATIATGIVDAGKISAVLGTLVVASTVSGSGSFSIGGPGAFLEFTNAGTITAATAVGFGAAAGGDLIIGDSVSFGAIISGFVHNDVIELPGFASTTTGSLSSSGLTYTVSDTSGDKIGITFASAQAAGSIYIGTSTTDGNIVVLHH